MISGPDHGAIRHDLEVDGLITSYLQAGTGPTVLLLHSGEYGASAELSWEYTIPVLSRRYHVIAPDWLGYGGTAKVHDFERGTGRLLSHTPSAAAARLPGISMSTRSLTTTAQSAQCGVS
jgi:pimeloyl-ACP methyl ester carboxylesterase